MKILIFNTLYFPYVLGGAEKSTQLIAEGLVESGHSVTVVCTGKTDAFDTINGVDVYYLKIKNIFWRYESSSENIFKKSLWRVVDIYNIFDRYKIIDIIHNVSPDIVHTNNIAGFSVSLWSLLKKFNLPIVHTIRDYYCLCAKSTMFSGGTSCSKQCFFCFCFTYNKKYFSRKVDAVVGVSSYIVDLHLRSGYFSSAKISSYIYNAVDTSNDLDALPCVSTPVFGFLGLISPHKGIEFLLEVISEIPNAKLLVAGNEYRPGYVDGLKRKFRLEDRVNYLGFISPDVFFGQINVLIHPALWNEPMPRIVLESFAHGVPVAVSRMGGNAELIEEGKTGWIFDINSPDELKNVINNCLEQTSKISSMRSNCIFSARKFTKKNVIERYLDVYKKATY